MRPRLERIAKYAGLATTAIEWSALLIYYIKQPIYFGTQYPISYYATLSETKWIFTGCYVLAALCFWLFARHHLVKYFDVPLKIFGISLILLACTGLYPFDFADKVSTIIHSLLATSSGLLFLVGMYVLTRKSKDAYLHKITIVTIFLSFMLSVIFLLLPKTSQLVFSFEAGSWLILQLWTIWLSFYTYKKETSINY